MKAAILADLLMHMSGDLDVYLSHSGRVTSLEKVSIEPRDSRCQCGHYPERHKLSVSQRVDRLFNNRVTGELGGCADCECEKYQKDERKVVILS